MTTTTKTHNRGCRDFPLDWAKLTRPELKRALRLAVRLGSLPDSQMWVDRIDRSTCKSETVQSDRQERIRAAFGHALGIRPLKIDNRSGGGVTTTSKYRMMLQDNPDNRGLRVWCRRYVRRWGQS